MRLLLFRPAVFHPEPIVMISSICIKYVLFWHSVSSD